MTPGPLPHITPDLDEQLTRTPLVDKGDGTLETVASPEALLKLLQSKSNDERWIFRGHSNAKYCLSPSLERFANEIRKPGGPPFAEAYVEREFKRRAHQYIQNPPRDKENLEWLALMQHYGAPTRLLDWTRSAYVAT